LAGQVYELVEHRRSWAEDRVWFLDGAGELASLPVAWTDLAAADPFVVVAKGRCPFRLADLLELEKLVEGLRHGRRDADEV
jgi:hypothetical protein